MFYKSTALNLAHNKAALELLCSLDCHQSDYLTRSTAVKQVVSGTRFSMLDWVRVTGLSCTKGVWYIYDWDTRSYILP